MKQCSKSAILAILAAVLVLSAATATLAAAVTVSGSFYDVKVVTSGSDGSMSATITTTGKNGYHCNMLYPWKLTVEQGTGITLPKPILKKDDAEQFEEPAVIFKVPYTAADSATLVTAALKLGSFMKN